MVMTVMTCKITALRTACKTVSSISANQGQLQGAGVNQLRQESAVIASAVAYRKMGALSRRHRRFRQLHSAGEFSMSEGNQSVAQALLTTPASTSSPSPHPQTLNPYASLTLPLTRSHLGQAVKHAGHQQHMAIINGADVDEHQVRAAATSPFP